MHEPKKEAVLKGADAAHLKEAVGIKNVLLKYQASYLAMARYEQLVIVEKSRRIGITWAEASDSVLYAATKRGGFGGGDDVNYIGPSLDMAREFIQACGDWARAFNYAAGDIEEDIFIDKGEGGAPDKHIKAFTITFASGNKIQALSSAPRSLRGRRGRVIIDEAAFHDNLAEILKAALALTMWGAAVRVISTHDGVSNAFNQLIHEVRSGEREGKVIKIPFQQAVDDELYERICLVTGKEATLEGKAAWITKIRGMYGDAAKEELDCIPSKSGGKYIPLTLIEAIAKDVPVIRWSQPGEFTSYPDHIRTAACKVWCDENLGPLLAKLDKSREHCFGSDFARTGDQSVIWPLMIAADLRRVTPFVVELNNIPFDQQREILFYIVDRLPRCKGGGMDARGNGSYLAEKAMQRYGSSIILINATEKWYMENTPPFKAAFENQMLTVPKDADVISDIHMFEEVNGVGRMPNTRKASKSDKSKKRHGDAGIACLHAHFASRQDSAPIEHDSAGGTDMPVGEMEMDDSIGFGVARRKESGIGF